MKHFFVDNFFKNVMIKWKICMAVNLWELRSDLSWKDAASSTEGMTSSAENLLHLTSFCLIVFSLLSAFLSSKQFRNNQIQLWNHWLLFNVFSLKYNWKKKLKSVYWAQKTVYRSPKWPAYVTAMMLFSLFVLLTVLS